MNTQTQPKTDTLITHLRSIRQHALARTWAEIWPNTRLVTLLSNLKEAVKSGNDDEAAEYIDWLEYAVRDSRQERGGDPETAEKYDVAICLLNALKEDALESRHGPPMPKTWAAFFEALVKGYLVAIGTERDELFSFLTGLIGNYPLEPKEIDAILREITNLGTQPTAIASVIAANVPTLSGEDDDRQRVAAVPRLAHGWVNNASQREIAQWFRVIAAMPNGVSPRVADELAKIGPQLAEVNAKAAGVVRAIRAISLQLLKEADIELTELTTASATLSIHIASKDVMMGGRDVELSPSNVRHVIDRVEQVNSDGVSLRFCFYRPGHLREQEYLLDQVCLP
ncbi:MAG: hypothetical protein PHT12_04990 [Patescibacteria group bacterium]|nr:hypothetical protein [Patescibacteria group bacterium]